MLLCPWDFSRQEYWNGLPFPSPGNLLDPGIEFGSPALQAVSLLSPREALMSYYLLFVKVNVAQSRPTLCNPSLFYIYFRLGK